MAAYNDDITQRVIRRIQQDRALQSIAEEYDNSEAYNNAVAEQKAQQYYDNRKYRDLMTQDNQDNVYRQSYYPTKPVQTQPVDVGMPVPVAASNMPAPNTRMKINPELFNTRPKVSNPLNGLPNFSYERTLPEVRYQDGGQLEEFNIFGRGSKLNKKHSTLVQPVWDDETEEPIYNGGTLPDIDIVSKPMSEFRKKWRRAWNMPITVPATAPNPTAIATWQYNPSNLMQTTPKQELDYLAALATPIAPYLTSGYFLGTGIGDMAENGVKLGNSVQVGLSALPFAPYALQADINAAGRLLQKTYPYMKEVSTFLKSPYTSKWATFGNKQYRFKPGYLGMNGAPIESRLTAPTITSENAAVTRGGTAKAPIKYQIQRYPGYMLKSLMEGNLLEKQLSKTGTINVNNIKAVVNKGSKVEQAVVDKVLASEKFAGKKSIDYNEFRKAVQDELITYDRTPDKRYADYGMDRLHVFDDMAGTNLHRVAAERFVKAHPELDYVSDEYGHIYESRELPGLGKIYDKPVPDDFLQSIEPDWFAKYAPTVPQPNTYTFSSPRIPNGSAKHYDPNTLAHSRTFTTVDEPDVLYVMESQSDWAQARYYDVYGRAYTKRSYPGTDYEAARAREKDFLTDEEIKMKDEYTSRLIQENMRLAAERGQKKMRYPTRETAAKIEGYPVEERILYLDKNGNPYSEPFEMDSEVAELREQLNKAYDDYGAGDISARDRISELVNKITEMPEKPKRLKEDVVTKKISIYQKEHETILKKYSAFPKQYQKLFKGADVRTVTDAKGNTWYEVDVPEDYMNRELIYQNGGTLNNSHAFGGPLESLVNKYDTGGPVWDNETQSYVLPEVEISKKRKGKFWDKFTKATIGAAMAENPAIMTAAGWKYDKDGNLHQRPDKDSDRLAENLAAISALSPTHPVNAVFELAPYAGRAALMGAAKAGSNWARGRVLGRALEENIANAVLPIEPQIGVMQEYRQVPSVYESAKRVSPKDIALASQVDNAAHEVYSIPSDYDYNLSSHDFSIPISKLKQLLKDPPSYDPLKFNKNIDKFYQKDIVVKEDPLDAFYKSLSMDKRFKFIPPSKFVNYDIYNMTAEEAEKIFGPSGKGLINMLDIAKAHNFEGKYGKMTKQIEGEFDKLFPISKSDPDVALGLERSRRLYSIPEYRERFNRFGTLGDTFVDDALDRLDNVQLQGINGDFTANGMKAAGSTTVDNLNHSRSPLIKVQNTDSSSTLQQVVQHEGGHASHGLEVLQPAWMKGHNEAIKPKLKPRYQNIEQLDENTANVVNYQNTLDEIVTRSKTTIEYADRIRKPGETLDDALDRVYKMAEMPNSSVPTDTKDLVWYFDKETLLNFWKNFVGGVAIPTGIGFGLGLSKDNQNNSHASGGNLLNPNLFEEGGEFENDNSSYLDNIAKGAYNMAYDDNPLASVVKVKEKGYYNIYPNENKNAITLLEPEYVKKGYLPYYRIETPILKQGDNYYIPAYESVIKDDFKNNLDYYLDFYGIDKSRFTEVPNSDLKEMLPERGYIGGSNANVRLNVISRMDLADKIESIAKKYEIDKNLLMHRLMHEGFLDNVARAYNEAPFAEDQEKDMLDYTPTAFTDFGLDYAAKYLRDKKMELLDDSIEWESLNEWTGDNIRLLLNKEMKEKYGNLFDADKLYHAEDIENLPKELRDYLVEEKHIGTINEKNRLIDHPSITDLNAALHMMAANMKRLYDLGIERGYSKDDINTYINAMYNMGEYHRDLDNKSWIKSTYSVPDWYKLLENFNSKKQNGGKLSVDGPLFDRLFNSNRDKAPLIYKGHKGLSKWI